LQKQHGPVLDVKAIGVKYIKHLISQGRSEKHSAICSLYACEQQQD
jgi:hypothetical protein